MRKQQLKLYWCWTDDHDEDWFVVAWSALDARRHHEEEEGYDPGMAHSKLVLTLPKSLQDERLCGWPSRRVLEMCGAEIERWRTPRVVKIKGVRYSEGMLQHEIDRRMDDAIERRGHGRPNRTEREGIS